MKKHLLKSKALKNIAVLGTTALLASCSIFEQKTYSWLIATDNNNIINYCLLIGQNDHSDSIERTRATRAALNTLDTSPETIRRTNNNPNFAKAIDGEIELGGFDGKPTKKFKTHELSGLEQKSLAGTTWDPITANNTTSTWIAKYGNKLTMVVSNNDGMAEGAYMAPNWISGLPLFGYDANSATLQLIKEGKVMGTISQNASAQCATAFMLIRNIYDHTHSGEAQVESWDPFEYGFSVDKQNKNGYGYVISTINKKEEEHAALLTNDLIDNDNINLYFNKDGTVKEAKDLYEQNVHFTKGTKGKIEVFHAYNSQTEAFLLSNMRPYFSIYKSLIDITDVEKMGTGTDEKPLLDAIASSKAYDAYLINMVKTVDAESFIEAIAKRLGQKEEEDWNKRSDVPLIFWNKQPQTSDGSSVDLEAMHNKYFKYTYYVGVDAVDGGEKQGNVILKYLNKMYINSLLDKR